MCERFRFSYPERTYQILPGDFNLRPLELETSIFVTTDESGVVVRTKFQGLAYRV